MSIATDIQQILGLASDYSASPTPAMRKRAELCKDLVVALESVVEGSGNSWLVDLNLKVKAGGQQGSVGPVPWVRIYSPQYSPNAYSGVYLVYLFAADGSRAYLSLMHGASEYRSGDMRAITDKSVLASRTAVARSTLGDLIETDGAAGTTMSIDLAWQGFSSPQRAQAYEHANILAREYPIGHIPPDERLTSELLGMMPLLARLYGESANPTRDDPGTQASPGATTGKSTGTAQGPLLDAETRRKIELHAEDHAVDYFSHLGWNVERVGHLKLGYDLSCTRAGGDVLHVEVKGTRTQGEKVVLTENEVRHIRETKKCGADHALYVLSNIEVTRDGETRCYGGQPTRIWPWTINDADLLPTEYSYTVPAR